MKIAEYSVSYSFSDKKKTFYVSIIDIPWHKYLWIELWEKIDPCCRKPWRLWYPLVSVYHNALTRKYRNFKETTFEVTEEWAKENYDWDISEKEELDGEVCDVYVPIKDQEEDTLRSVVGPPLEKKE